MDDIERIGRRIKLRDLRTLLAVGQSGNMSKAAQQLSVSHPVVSKTISNLEHTLGGRLFDRTSRGVESTPLGRALVDCSVAMLDELQRALHQVALLSDPTAGQLRIGATGPLTDGLVLAAIESMISRYPRIDFCLLEGDSPTLYRALRERKIDLAVSRTFRPSLEISDTINCEFLFHERLFVVAGLQSAWVPRRKLKLDQLRDAPWVMPEHENPVGYLIAESFRLNGVAPIKARVVSNSLAARVRLVTNRGFLTMLPGSMLQFGASRLPVKALRVALPMKPQAIEIVTLENRALSAVAKTFIECLHKIARPLAKGSF